jgi:hypothetical protein
MLINKSFKYFLPVSQLSMVGSLLSIGLVTSSFYPTWAAENKTPTTTSKPMVVAKLTASDTPAVAGRKQLRNGIYVFGQTSQPEQIGKEYLVFESRGSKVIGAFYMPASEYSCFYGTLKQSQMDLTTVDPEDGSTYTHSIALQPSSLVASNRQIALQGYQPVTRISDNAQQILKNCRSNYQK